jgi:hypothetical protein
VRSAQPAPTHGPNSRPQLQATPTHGRPLVSAMAWRACRRYRDSLAADRRPPLLDTSAAADARTAGAAAASAGVLPPGNSRFSRVR